MGDARVVGLVVPDIRNPFFTDVARGAEERAGRDGLTVRVVESAERVDREAEHLQRLADEGAVGVVVAPVREVPPQLDRLRDAGVPAVLVDRRSEHGDRSSASVDDGLGGRLAAEHLLGQGRRSLLFVGGPLGQPQFRDRLEGARAAVRTVPGAKLRVLPVAYPTLRDGIGVAEDVVAFGRRVDALLAANDLLALGLLKGLGVPGGPTVPGDLALVGYDDIDLAATAAVPVTSVRRPRRRLGAAAVDLLLRELAGEDPAQVVLAPRLVIRASSAAG